MLAQAARLYPERSEERPSRVRGKIEAMDFGGSTRPWYRRRQLTRQDKLLSCALLIVALVLLTVFWTNSPWWHVWAVAAAWAATELIGVEARRQLSRGDS
jgi:uncharacterized membrane protein YbaN (DUF454 family)